MSDVKAAAERSRKIQAGEDGLKVYLPKDPGAEYTHLASQILTNLIAKDKSDLANAYLAEHPADDSERLTGEWVVKAIPFRGRSGGIQAGSVSVDIHTEGVFRCEFEVWWNEFGCWVRLFGAYLMRIETRSDLRLLCRALGISLEGKA